jgi:hypothetical protein
MALDRAVAQCDERLNLMRQMQAAYHDADVNVNQPALTKALRRFREEHFAFLNASYSLGDSLKCSTIRQFLRAEVNPYLATPLASFHRGLRDCLDHGGSLEYGLAMNVQWQMEITPPATFPVPDIPTAALYGIPLRVSQEGPTLGRRVMVFRNQHLEAHLAALLDAVRKQLGTKEDPSVILLAERHLEDLRQLAIRASREHRLKSSSTT